LAKIHGSRSKDHERGDQLAILRRPILGNIEISKEVDAKELSPAQIDA
jgi:hypothetical protein